MPQKLLHDYVGKAESDDTLWRYFNDRMKSMVFNIVVVRSVMMIAKLSMRFYRVIGLQYPIYKKEYVAHVKKRIWAA